MEAYESVFRGEGCLKIVYVIISLTYLMDQIILFIIIKGEDGFNFTI
jgi:hypothetical protein